MRIANSVFTNQFLADVDTEMRRATMKHKPMNSLHEAYAVLAEEVDELWDEVRKKSSERDGRNVYTELVQIAAMAARTAYDLGYIIVPSTAAA